MTPDEFLHGVLDPGLAWCATVPGWKIPVSDKARVLLTAIAGQESAWTYRIQNSPGASAHSFFQMERRGGVAGVMGDIATAQMAQAACRAAGVPFNSAAVWGAFSTPHGDNLSVAFARLLLWSDPSPLPDVGDEDDSYETYIRNWRPGRPSRDRWASVYPRAVAAVTGGKA